jgi:transposase
MSLSEIGRTLRCGGLRPHRVRIWLHSPDPDFQAKAKAICELYLSPPPGATVLCFDEKPGMQAREQRHPIHAARGVSREEFEYIRHATSTLLAAFNVRTGEVSGRCCRRTAAGVIKFFEQLAREYPTGDVYIVMDNLNVHKGPAVEEFLARHGGRFHFVYTPLHASWINQVEVWFGILQRCVLRHGSFCSKRELEAAVLSFVSLWNLRRAHPFRWRFRGDFESRALPWAA